MKSRHGCFIGLALAWGLALAGAGCGKKSGDFSSPEAAFKTFDQAMQKKDYALAASCFAYEAQAQQQNSDWDTIQKGQRQLIIGKLRAQQKQNLAQWPYPEGGLTVSQQATQGNFAQLAVTGGGQTLQVQMTQTADGWKILSGVGGR